jgi:hypothetical protein
MRGQRRRKPGAVRRRLRALHNRLAPNWDAGHNNAGNYAAKTTDGFWFRHLGAFTGSTTMMGETMQVTKDQAFPLMPAGLAKLLPC